MRSSDPHLRQGTKGVHAFMPRPALIIEDDPDIAESVRYNLESEGFAAVVASTGEQGLEMALNAQNPPMVIVLDLMLPASAEPSCVAACVAKTKLAARRSSC